MKIFLFALLLYPIFCQPLDCNKASLRKEIKRLVQYDNISLFEIQKINKCYREIYGVSITDSGNYEDAFNKIKKLNNSNSLDNTLKAPRSKPRIKPKKKILNKSSIRKPKGSFIETLEDSLSSIHEEINFLLYEYDRIIDLSRNILKSNLENNKMWPYVYLTPSIKYTFYRFEGDDLVNIGKSSLDHVIAVYTDRITRSDGRQLIYAQERDLMLPGSIREGFIDYRKVRSSLPKEFVSNIESISFRDHDKNKELIDKSVTGINPTELERWINVTGYLLNEEVKSKADKKIDQKKRSELLSLIIVSLFVVSLNQ